MKMKLADALAPKRGGKIGTGPGVEYDFTPNTLKSAYGSGTGYGTTPPAAKPRASQLPKKLKR